MGEVRVSVKLTNAGDEVLVRRGLLPESEIRRYTADALVGTGAVATVLPLQVVEQLGLALTGRRLAEYADGRTEAVEVTEAVTIDLNGRHTTEDTLVLGTEVIIGQTVLEKLDLLPDCANRRLIPNPAHPDQPVLKIK